MKDKFNIKNSWMNVIFEPKLKGIEDVVRNWNRDEIFVPSQGFIFNKINSMEFLKR